MDHSLMCFIDFWKARKKAGKSKMLRKLRRHRCHSSKWIFWVWMLIWFFVPRRLMLMTWLIVVTLCQRSPSTQSRAINVPRHWKQLRKASWFQNKRRTVILASSYSDGSRNCSSTSPSARRSMAPIYATWMEWPFKYWLCTSWKSYMHLMLAPKKSPNCSNSRSWYNSGLSSWAIKSSLFLKSGFRSSLFFSRSRSRAIRVNLNLSFCNMRKPSRTTGLRTSTTTFWILLALVLTMTMDSKDSMFSLLFILRRTQAPMSKAGHSWLSSTKSKRPTA